MKIFVARGGARWLVWLPLLGIAAWLALFGDRSRSPAIGSTAEVSAPVRNAQSNSFPAKAASRQEAGLIPRAQLISAATKDTARDLFVARSWTPPPPPAPVVQETPSAPPLPFAFLGKKLEGQAWEIYLARGDQTLIVRAGTVLDGTYRVDSVQPPALVMTYLPLGQQQTLPIGDSQ